MPLYIWKKSYQCTLQEDQAVFYKTEVNGSSIPRKKSIKINNKDLHIQLFLNGCPLPLPPWFRNGINHCWLTSYTQLENFPAYIRLVSYDVASSISEELHLFSTEKEYIRLISSDTHCFWDTHRYNSTSSCSNNFIFPCFQF